MNRICFLDNRSAGLVCRMLIGYKKGASHVAGRRLKESRETGIWFAVFLEGEWRFIDAHWGCCANNATDDTCHTNEFYFLTDPDQFIFTHWPFEKNWQLLVTPLTFENFEDLPIAQPEELQEAGLELASHPKGVIIIPNYAQVSSLR